MTTLRRKHSAILTAALASMILKPILNTGFPTAGISVNSLVTDPVSLSTLYAVVTNTLSAHRRAIANSLYKTTDEGASWGALNTRLSPSAHIAADRTGAVRFLHALDAGQT